jgi:hypothetical protein
MLRARTRFGYVLRVHRWRVLENAGAEEKWLGPARVQRRNCGKLNGRKRRADQRDVGRVIAAARCNQCNGAGVLCAVSVPVDLRV